MTSHFLRLMCVVTIVTLAAACSGPGERGDRARATATPTAVAPSPTASSAAAPSATRDTAPTATATNPLPSPTRTPTTTPTLVPSPTATPEPTAIPTPTAQAIGLPDIDVHYALEISELDVDTGFVRARELITISRIGSPAPQPLYLQVVPAAWGFFTLDGATVAGVEQAPNVLNDGFTLTFDLPPDMTAPAEITLDFRLAVGTESSGWGGTSLDAGILRLGYWFPIVSDDHGYSDTLDPSYTASASFEVSLVVAPDIVVAHTGEVVAQEAQADGRVRYHLRAQDVRDFALILSRGYEVATATAGSGVAVELYTVAVDAGTEQAILGWAVDALDQLESLVGPYPYPTYRIVDAGPTMPGGLEFPGLIYINPAYAPLDRLIYHETAHQWLYGIIGNRTLLDGWIDEGGAEFFERGLPTGFTEVPAVPAGGYAYWLDAGYQELAADGSRQWYFSIYEQGARFYYAVLAAMGGEAFWGAMRDLYATYRFGIMTAWDVLATWQEHSASDLRPLFAEYFRYDWIGQLPAPGSP